MREYGRGTKTSNGHSFIMRRPSPASPELFADAPPRTVPVEIDITQWIREVLTVATVMGAAARAIARSPLNPSIRHELAFGGRTWIVAFLLALILPLPFVGAVSFAPWWFLTDVNHASGAGWVAATFLWLIISFGLYLVLGLIAYVIQRFGRRRAGYARTPA